MPTSQPPSSLEHTASCISSGARRDRISIRVSPEERAELERNRTQAGSQLDLGAWIREVALKPAAAAPTRRESELVTPNLLATLRADLAADIARVGKEVSQLREQTAHLAAGLNAHGRALAQILKLLGAV